MGFWAEHIFQQKNQRREVIFNIKKLSALDWLPTGEEYCPDCHKLLMHRDGYWKCDICKYSITDDDGYPTLDSTYEDDYGTYYEDDDKLECDIGYKDCDYHEEY